MTRQYLPSGIDFRPDALGNPQDHAPRQRAPQTAQTADDHRLERIKQTRRPDRWVHIRPNRQEHPGNRGHPQRNRHGKRKKPAAVDPHQLRYVAIV